MIGEESSDGEIFTPPDILDAASALTKVNGDEKKETPMEVDDTDNAQQTEQKDDTETKMEEQTTDTEQSETDKAQTENSKPETTDTSSQETTDSDTKSQAQESQESQKDIEMPEERTEVNGTPESQIIEPKSVDVISGNPITTTA